MLYQEGIRQEARRDVVSRVLSDSLQRKEPIEICISLDFSVSIRHVIVGRNFGSYVTHETKHFIYFYIGQVAILMFKSG